VHARDSVGHNSNHFKNSCAVQTMTRVAKGTHTHTHTHLPPSSSTVLVHNQRGGFQTFPTCIFYFCDWCDSIMSAWWFCVVGCVGGWCWAAAMVPALEPSAVPDATSINQDASTTSERDALLGTRGEKPKQGFKVEDVRWCVFAPWHCTALALQPKARDSATLCYPHNTARVSVPALTQSSCPVAI
jgi:hypothetical protein